MISLRRHFRLPCIALVAIVGTLSMVGEVSACTVKAAIKATRSCCAALPVSNCCCEPSSSESATPASVVSLTNHGLSTSTVPCECRRGDPTESAPKPESPSSERRSDQDRGESVDLTFETHSSITFARLILPPGCLPKIPLYLRTSRLLI